jgi:P-type Cu+ transporter
MAKDPVCGMFVEEKNNAIRHTVEGRVYFFCSTYCLNGFIAPEKEFKKLKIIQQLALLLQYP